MRSTPSAYLLYNPAAGRFPAGPFIGRAVKALENAGWSIEVIKSVSSSDLTQGALEAVEAECEAVFIVGGDGSVGLIAGQLTGTPTALGVLPSGTGNAWAKELGLPRLGWIHWTALERAARRLARPTIRSVDVGDCNGNIFLLWGGLGLDAYIVNRIEPRGRFEKILASGYYMTRGLWMTRDWKGVDLRIQALGETWEGRYILMVASNIPGYAGGFVELAPEARIDDGLLDFWLIEGRSFRDILIRLAQLFRGTHIHAPGVLHFQAKEAVIDFESQLPVHFDGEPSIIEPPLHFRVRKRALRVLVPEASYPRLFTRDPQL